jgi:predicted acetyltransferase
MLTRTDYREWCSDPYKSLNYTYLFYTDDKIPDGYINFKINSNNIVVNEMAYYSPKTLLNILGFLRMYDGQYTDVIIHNVDLYSDFESYIGEFRNVSYEIYDGPMVRILDVKEYLNKIIKPSFDFVLVIKINDIYIDKNNKTFKLEYNNNLLNITETQEKADIECDISTFSSIATGSRMINNNNYIFYNSIKIFDKSELFFNLFPAVPMNQFDRF